LQFPVEVAVAVLVIVDVTVLVRVDVAVVVGIDVPVDVAVAVRVDVAVVVVWPVLVAVFVAVFVAVLVTVDVAGLVVWTVLVAVLVVVVVEVPFELLPQPAVSAKIPTIKRLPNVRMSFPSSIENKQSYESNRRSIAPKAARRASLADVARSFGLGSAVEPWPSHNS
jgi:hypothetical protein